MGNASLPHAGEWPARRRSKDADDCPLRFSISTNKTPSWLGLENDAVFHHEIHLFECRNIRERIATNRD